MARRTLISGGLVVGAAGSFHGDVLISDGVISAVGTDLSSGLAGDADHEVIDARGRYVLPGAIDTHTHMDMPVGEISVIDDFASGTAAAAAGGTTTIVDFAVQQPGQSPAQTIAAWQRKLADAPPLIDVGFHFALTDLAVPGAAEELAALPAQGITSFKLFMAYPGTLMVGDRTMLAAMRIAAASSALVLVHAENGDMIEMLAQDALGANRTAPVWHVRTRPVRAETEATGRALSLAAAAGCPVYIVHVSCAGAQELVRAARASGEPVFAETCPHYLVLTEADLDRPGFEGAKYVCSPPLRTTADQERLWSGLAQGTLDAVASDHSPFLYRGQKSLGAQDFSRIPNGVGGVEERVMLLHHFGVRAGRLTLHRLVELTATAPARMFGLHPRKGAIVPGADADLVVFDPERRRVLGASGQQSRCDYSLYEGFEVRGAPEHVLLRGECVVRDGRVAAAPPRGQFVARARQGESLAMHERAPAPVAVTV